MSITLASPVTPPLHRGRYRRRHLGGGLALALVMAASVVGCGPDDDVLAPPVGSEQDAIVNGQPDDGHPAVVGLVAQGQIYCSATLITPTVVLTAAHCLPPNIPTAFTNIQVFFGSSAVNGGQLRQVADGWTNPAWNDQAIYEDIGMLRLSDTAPTAPIPLNTTALSAGQSTTLVGFGVTTASGSNSGVKRVGTATIDQLDAQVIAMVAAPSSTCYGDSGGTTLIDVDGTEHIAGVHSRADCAGSSIDMRVDAYLDDIQAFAGASADCGADGLCAQSCAAPDPDCPCAGDGFCTTACPDSSNDPDCDPDCGENGVCAMNCAQPDVDCDCSENGQCNGLCGSEDPDCIPVECRADGQCNTSCELDPDCWTAPELVRESHAGTSFSTCRASGVRASREAPQSLWLLLGLTALVWRRKRR